MNIVKSEKQAAAVGLPYTPAQQQLFRIAYRAAEAVNRAIHNQLKEMQDWLREQYGDIAPTYEQFWQDRDALKYLAAERGLVDDQWVRKPYNAAVKSLYGDLPVSPNLPAVAKRTARPKTAKASAAARKVVKAPVMPSTAEAAIRQVLDHFGMPAVLQAFAVILAEHRTTAVEAKRMAALGKQVASLAH